MSRSLFLTRSIKDHEAHSKTRQEYYGNSSRTETQTKLLAICEVGGVRRGAHILPHFSRLGLLVRLFPREIEARHRAARADFPRDGHRAAVERVGAVFVGPLERANELLQRHRGEGMHVLHVASLDKRSGNIYKNKLYYRHVSSEYGKRPFDKDTLEARHRTARADFPRDGHCATVERVGAVVVGPLECANGLLQRHRGEGVHVLHVASLRDWET